MEYSGKIGENYVWRYAPRKFERKEVSPEDYQVIFQKMEDEICQISQPVHIIDLSDPNNFVSCVISQPRLVDDTDPVAKAIKDVWSKFSWEDNPKMPVVMVNQQVVHVGMGVFDIEEKTFCDQLV